MKIPTFYFTYEIITFKDLLKAKNNNERQN